ncbi:hypothetical protein BDQ12DRAFT_525127 [Crucibulum laeve]|uniref:Uncharacterized protein n=1 Tax=Crucibulum laeve TaxID=68775 RepID=A0A5C3LHC9_9AGAR|nr:hypothetical protein BDQ12DRAFT_525127 [Crucibulum laeve]
MWLFPILIKLALRLINQGRLISLIYICLLQLWSSQVLQTQKIVLQECFHSCYERDDEAQACEQCGEGFGVWTEPLRQRRICNGRLAFSACCTTITLLPCIPEFLGPPATSIRHKHSSSYDHSGPC